MSYGFGLPRPTRKDITRVLGLSMDIGGRSAHNQAVEEGIRRLGAVLDEAGSGLPVKGLVVELKFMVPGPVMSPDFEGIQQGTFFRSLDALAIMVAVPDGLTADESPQFFIETLSTARDLAKRFANTRKKTPLSTQSLESAFERAIERMRREGLPSESDTPQ